MDKSDPTAGAALLALAGDHRTIPNLLARVGPAIQKPADSGLAHFLPAFARAREVLSRDGVFLDAMTLREVKVDREGLGAALDEAERDVLAALKAKGP